jgi:hypothetical protein
MGSVYFGTANGSTRLPTATYPLLTLPILGRSRHTIGISIPQTIGRIRWPVTPNGKSGQPHLGIELPAASILMIGGVYFGTADGPTSPPSGGVPNSHTSRF